MAKFEIVTPIMLAHAYGTMGGAAPAQLFVAGLTQGEVHDLLREAQVMEKDFLLLPMMPHSGKDEPNPLVINRHFVIYVAKEVPVADIKDDLLPNPGEENVVPITRAEKPSRRMN